MENQRDMISSKSRRQVPFQSTKTKEKLLWVFIRAEGCSKYRHIKNDVVYNIRQKVLLPGEEIPPESWYREIYRVSAITVRKAFSDLIHEDVLYAEQGRGTFVKRRALHWKTVAGDFARNLEETWYIPHTKILDVRTVMAPEIAKLFELPPSEPLTMVKRLRYDTEEPAAVSISYLPQNVLSCDERIFLERRRSLYKVLADKGIEPYSTKETFSIGVISEKEIYTLLRYGRNEPVIYGQRFNYDASKHLFEYTRNYLRSDIYQIVCYHQRALGNTEEGEI